MAIIILPQTQGWAVAVSLPFNTKSKQVTTKLFEKMVLSSLHHRIKNIKKSDNKLGLCREKNLRKMLQLFAVLKPPILSAPAFGLSMA